MSAIKTDFRDYIGDGVYADFDGYHVVLTTERMAPSRTATICLDNKQLAALDRYREWLKQRLAEIRAHERSTQRKG